MRRQDFYIQSIGGYSLPFGRWLLVKFGCLLRAPMDFKRFHRWLLGIRVTMARCIRSHYKAPSVQFSEQYSLCYLFIYVASNIILLTYLLISPLSLFLTVRNSQDALVKPIKWNASARYWITVRDYVVGKSSFCSHCYLVDIWFALLCFFLFYHFLFFILKLWVRKWFNYSEETSVLVLRFGLQGGLLATLVEQQQTLTSGPPDSPGCLLLSPALHLVL